ncbi:DUF413 domain-containing protein [Aestuariicella hydrocarbonica]|uniref:Macrodomain Ori protein n=1 Tax=Pseudomaricurvus hydrocarbonicus TaxID=1470433 RepID=A0A9E5MJJ0_9GAMM|nr:DUF413 domain-containing protein [Aestuariicella hydrocarbonica]NHO64087.1 DUF413 domain-containing protein [Aestuariicella hydrocarbonica]
MATQFQDFDQKGRKFWGTDHFPYGFARSGEFTREQVQLLENHGYAYLALASGERTPVTPEEQEFVKYCLGEKEPQSRHEKVWAIFQKKSSRNVVFVSLGASSNDDDGVSSEPFDVEEF